MMTAHHTQFVISGHDVLLNNWTHNSALAIQIFKARKFKRKEYINYIYIVIYNVSPTMNPKGSFYIKECVWIEV